MPRNFEDHPGIDESDELIPDLTYANAKEMFTTADYIMFSLGPARPAELFDGAPPTHVTTDRLKHLTVEFYNEFEEQLFDKTSFARVRKFGTAYHAKLAPSDPTVFDELEAFLERMIPLWGYAAISYCWADNPHPRANTLLYELRDAMPPHPETELYAYQADDPVKLPSEPDMTESEFEEFAAVRDRHFEYEESADAPRFSYGPTYVLNGDYNAAGSDLLAYAWEHFTIDLRFDTGKTDTPSEAFPSTYSAPFYDAVVEFVEDYPNNISVSEITGKITHIKEEDVPAPINPEKLD